MLAEPLPLLAVIVVDDFFRGLRGGQVSRDHANQHLSIQFMGLDLLRGIFPQRRSTQAPIGPCPCSKPVYR